MQQLTTNALQPVFTQGPNYMSHLSTAQTWISIALKLGTFIMCFLFIFIHSLFYPGQGCGESRA